MSDTMLIDLAPAAAEKVIALSEGAPERAYLHVFPAGQGGCRTMYGLAFMSEAGSDFEVFEAHGVKMAVANETREAVAGVAIDYVQTPQGEGFTVMKADPSDDGGGCPWRSQGAPNT